MKNLSGIQQNIFECFNYYGGSGFTFLSHKRKSDNENPSGIQQTIFECFNCGATLIFLSYTRRLDKVNKPKGLKVVKKDQKDYRHDGRWFDFRQKEYNKQTDICDSRVTFSTENLPV